MYKSLPKKVFWAALAGAYVFSTSVVAAPLDLSDVPLVVAPPAPPNIMIMVDTSGSMEHVSPGLPYLDTNTTASWNTCDGSGSNAAELSPGTTVSLRIRDGHPLIRVGSNNYTWGPNTDNQTRVNGNNYNHRCFDNNATYKAKLTTFSASSTGDEATYTGHYLNYYFYLPVATYTTTGSWSGRQYHPNQKSRMVTGQNVINNFVDNQIDDSIYLGLTDFNVIGSVTNYNSRGAQLHEEVTLLDSSKKTAIKARVNSLSAGGVTPLAESLAGIGRYFIGTSFDPTLTLHPSAATPTTNSASSVFPTANIVGASGAASPISSAQFCQKNFAIMMTDGRATHDRDISTSLRDYDGDCASPTNPSCSGFDIKSSNFNDGSPSGYGYDSFNPSDYLDDVAQALYEIDLRPDINDLSGNNYLNNIVTYLIGFADIGVKSDQMFKDAASQGSGGARIAPFLPNNEAELTLAFEEIIADIFAQQGAFAAVSFNTGQLTNNSAVYQGRFSTKPWSGSLLAFTLNGTTGTINQPRIWDAGFVLDQLPNPATARNVITRNPAAISGTSDGLSVSSSVTDWAALPAQLKNDLLQGPDADQDSNTNEDDDAKMLLDYLLGDSTNEGAGITNYRIRDNNQLTAANAPEPSLPIRNRLGDIVNSAPVFVGAPESSWPEFGADNRFGASGSSGSYSSYQSASAGRRPMLYVGANDGMLHGFDANLTGSAAGSEVIAYMPTQLFSSSTGQGLHYLADRNYRHKYYVDGTPIASDVYIDNGSGAAAWRTVLVGGLRGGGRGLYALDVSNPSGFSTPANKSDIVLWEFTNTDDADLGYVYGKISIGMMANGRWAAIIGNGYNSTGSGNASLFIVYIERGADGTWSAGDYKKIDTGANVLGTPNGLSTPTPIDLDGDSVIDRIYAGDLEGNIWAFDVSGTADSSWGVDYSGPLFTACTSTPCSNSNRQAITAELSVVKNTASSGSGIDPDLLLLFGTGKYLENADPEDTTLHSYYSVWDSGVGGFEKDNLEPRTLDDSQLINSNPVRFISGSNFTYGPTRKGWYFDFNTQSKERVISDSLTRRGLTAFTTIIPSRVVCSSGGSGSLMALDLITGLASSDPVLDADGDGVVDGNDVGSGGGNFSGKLLYGYLPSELNARGGRVYFGTTGEEGSGNNGGGTTVAGIDEEPVDWPDGDGFEGRWTWEEALRP